MIDADLSACLHLTSSVSGMKSLDDRQFRTGSCNHISQIPPFKAKLTHPLYKIRRQLHHQFTRADPATRLHELLLPTGQLDNIPTTPLSLLDRSQRGVIVKSIFNFFQLEQQLVRCPLQSKSDLFVRPGPFFALLTQDLGVCFSAVGDALFYELLQVLDRKSVV